MKRIFAILIIGAFITACDPLSPAHEENQHDSSRIILPSIEAPITGTTPQNEEILHEGYFALFTNPNNNGLPYSFIDLDQGEKGFADKEHGDIEFIVSGGSAMFSIIQPVNGALGHVMNPTGTKLMDCLKELKKFTKGNIPDFPLGGTCILTNENRMAILEFKDGGFGVSGNYYVIFSYRVFKGIYIK